MTCRCWIFWFGKFFFVSVSLRLSPKSVVYNAILQVSLVTIGYSKTFNEHIFFEMSVESWPVIFKVIQNLILNVI